MLAQINFQSIWESLQQLGLSVWEYFTNPWILGFLAGIVICLIALYVLSKRQPKRIRAFNNDNGYVEISRPALVDIIRSTSEQVDIEKKPGVQIQTKRGKLHVDVKIRLLPSRRLTEVSEILQKHLIETLEGGMGIRKLGNINVVVVGVRTKPEGAARLNLPFHGGSKKSTPDESMEPVEVLDPVESEEQPIASDADADPPVEENKKD